MRFWVRGHARAVGDGGGRGVPPRRLQRRAGGQGGARSAAQHSRAAARLGGYHADLRPVADHREQRRRRRSDAATSRSSGGAGDLPVPGPRHRHADSRRGAAAVAAADVRGHEHAGLQPGQSFADGA